MLLLVRSDIYFVPVLFNANQHTLRTLCTLLLSAVPEPPHRKATPRVLHKAPCTLETSKRSKDTTPSTAQPLFGKTRIIPAVSHGRRKNRKDKAETKLRAATSDGHETAIVRFLAHVRSRQRGGPQFSTSSLLPGDCGAARLPEHARACAKLHGMNIIGYFGEWCHHRIKA